MKKQLLIVLLFSIALCTNAQKYFNTFIGFEAAKSANVLSRYGFYHGEKQLSAPIGIEYYHNKWKLSVGYSYGKTFFKQYQINEYDNVTGKTVPYYYKYRNTNYQIPITLGYNIHNNPNSPFQVFLFGGYSFGKLYGSTQYQYKETPENLVQTTQYNSNYTIQYLMAGMEGRYIYKNFLVSGTFQLKDRFDEKYYLAFYEPLWSASLKIGYIFGRK